MVSQSLRAVAYPNCDLEKGVRGSHWIGEERSGGGVAKVFTAAGEDFGWLRIVNTS